MSILKFRADRLPLSSGVALLAAIFLCAFTLSSSALAQGKIVGHIDGVTFDGTNGVVRGWACQQGRPESIAVQVFADGKFLVGGKADLKNEPGVHGFF